MRSSIWVAAFLIASGGAIAGAEPPIPADVNVVTPDAALPAPLAGYAGRWSGMWIGAGDRLPHILIVEKISPESFSAVYAWGDSQGEYGSLKAGSRRITGTVADGKLSAKLGPASVVYILKDDGTIAGTFTNARGFESKATLKKQKS